MIEIVEADIKDEDAILLIDELNGVLSKITGASGAKSFRQEDMEKKRSVFLIAYMDGAPCGCGAIRERSDDTAEMKRVYARPNRHGVGTMILDQLERKAKSFGYKELVLETRRINQRAVSFYKRHNYEECNNYGKYIGRAEAICFHKNLV